MKKVIMSLLLLTSFTALSEEVREFDVYGELNCSTNTGGLGYGDVQKPTLTEADEDGVRAVEYNGDEERFSFTDACVHEENAIKCSWREGFGKSYRLVVDLSDVELEYGQYHLSGTVKRGMLPAHGISCRQDVVTLEN